MSKYQYVVVPAQQAIERQYLDSGFYRDSEDVSVLYLFEDGKPIKAIASDGGEPEDNFFRRDLRVYVDELNKLIDVLNAVTEQRDMYKRKWEARNSA